MIEQLFGSKTRVKLLQLFLSNPNRSFYVREITRKIDEQINSVRRELSNLLSIGIITSDNTNNRLYYEVNQKYQYYEPLAAIFGGRPMSVSVPKKSAPVAAVETEDKAEKVEHPKPTPIVAKSDPLLEQFKKAGHIDLLVLTGQFTRDNASGVDLLVVGEMNDRAIEKAIADLEKAENKELRYAVFSTDEFKYRQTIKDRFLVNVLMSKKQVLIDTDNLLS